MNVASLPHESNYHRAIRLENHQTLRSVTLNLTIISISYIASAFFGLFLQNFTGVYLTSLAAILAILTFELRSIIKNIDEKLESPTNWTNPMIDTCEDIIHYKTENHFLHLHEAMTNSFLFQTYRNCGNLLRA